MSRLESLRRRVAALERAIPEPAPWPPALGTMGYCLWQELGEPIERMSFMDMYLEQARLFWAAEVAIEA